MSILTVILVIALVGVLLWAINTYLPMQQGIKTLLNVVVVLVLIIWLLKAFGVLGSLSNVTV
jgi:hypothetical protein